MGSSRSPTADRCRPLTSPASSGSMSIHRRASGRRAPPAPVPGEERRGWVCRGASQSAAVRADLGAARAHADHAHADHRDQLSDRAGGGGFLHGRSPLDGRDRGASRAALLGGRRVRRGGGPPETSGHGSGGGWLDTMLDRYADAAVVVGITLGYAAGHPAYSPGLAGWPRAQVPVGELRDKGVRPQPRGAVTPTIGSTA